MGTPAAAAGTTSVAVPNSSFGDGWLDGKLKCWNTGPSGAAKLTLTSRSHSGPWAAHATGTTAAGSQVVLSTDRTEACPIPVTAGRQYTLGFWMSSSAGAQPVVSSYSTTAGWTEWFRGTKISATTDLRRYTAVLPVVPTGVTRLSVGLSFPGTGTVVLDDVDLTAPETVLTAPQTTAPAAPAALFQPVFPASGLVTNEFAYWNPTDPQRADSRDWEMTSGSLFALDGSGYSGKVDGGSPDVRSVTNTGSAIFRLNTRDHSFGDVQVAMKLNVSGLTATSRTPAVDWDGVHIFLHYQSQYELYYASVARRDGHVVIKKKCLGGPSNGGAYYALGSSEVSGLSLPLNSWQDVGASIRNNADGSVFIALQRNGKTVSTATDSGVGCAPIRAAGATGIRGDNAEFRFSGFTVSALG
ncbi:hypothetical protein [Actinoplanes nipponensis]|uniref:hypothetical protein n=1 Tax=Actinoplanes nipponensis TaxID=135950 RepID=UPI0031E82B81